MGFFDIFGGKDAAEEAAAKNAALYQQYGANANNIYNTYGTTARSDLSDALARSTGAFGAGLTNQVGAYQTGTNLAADAGKAGVAAWNPLSKLGDSYSGAVNSYYDALGLNGPGGNDRAVSQYRTAPGYQF